MKRGKKKIAPTIAKNDGIERSKDCTSHDVSAGIGVGFVSIYFLNGTRNGKGNILLSIPISLGTHFIILPEKGQGNTQQNRDLGFLFSTFCV